jgi:hypothetical protein
VRDGASVAVFVAVLTALTYLVFPGHTYLQQDTQIYLPMLEKLENPALFTRELLTSRPHLAWTVYDETALGLRRATGLSFETILSGEQLLFRAFGIWGVFLIGASLGFTRRLSMFITALFSLGAMIVGPQVLTIEYEPVPRGFALPLVLCAIGLALDRRRMAASLAATVALLYHAPTTAVFWLVFAVLLWRARDWKPALIPAGGLAILIVLSRLQPGLILQQPLLTKISPALAELQRMRASYNWVSLWPVEAWVHYAVMGLVCALALGRLRPRLSPEHRIVFLGLLVAAVLSVPFSWITLEGMRWALIPQFQPARAVLFITALGVILSSAAGIQAAYERRYSEAFVWMLVPFIIPVHRLVTPPYLLKDAVLIAGLAAAATGAIAVHVVTPRRAAAALAMASLLAYFAVPLVGDVHNYPALWNGEIVKLAQWARASSAGDAVFLFPRAGKGLHPGIFRAEAQRAVYVDWKGGGQVNYFEDLAMEWWKRWQGTILRNASDAELAGRGVNYVVVELKDVRPGVSPVYSNAVYAVYRVQ